MPSSWVFGWVIIALMCGCGRTGEPPKTLHVYAASSLAESFRDLATAFESEHRGTRVALTFAGSQVLRVQIAQGAPADVYASANAEHMQALITAGLVAHSAAFVANSLVVIVPLDNPARIQSLADLPRARRLVIGTQHTPVGKYTRRWLRTAGAGHGPGFTEAVLARVVSEENNVRLVRAKVELGEADAAVVYRTDALASKRVALISIPPQDQARADYRVGIVTAASDPDLARLWLTLLRSQRARVVFDRHGFLERP